MTSNRFAELQKKHFTYLQKSCTTSRSKCRAILVATLLSKSWESAESQLGVKIVGDFFNVPFRELTFGRMNTL